MNKVFKKLPFWNLFTHLERNDVAEEDVEEWLNELAEDYSLRKEKFEVELDGQQHTGTNRILLFNFNCGRYELQLEYTAHPEGSEKYLYLLGPKKKKQLMGWWNLENWHPFCLHEEELYQLLDYWQKNDKRWENRDLALVLLHDFVGFTDWEQADAFAKEVYEAYQRLAVKNIRKAHQKPVAVFVYEDSAYHWEQHNKLGWIFTSDVYACYSIRNEAHSTGNEGRFPFEDWQKMMREI